MFVVLFVSFLITFSLSNSTPPGADQRWLYENVLKVVTELREIKDGQMRNGSRHSASSETQRLGESEK